MPELYFKYRLCVRILMYIINIIMYHHVSYVSILYNTIQYCIGEIAERRNQCLGLCQVNLTTVEQRSLKSMWFALPLQSQAAEKHDLKVQGFCPLKSHGVCEGAEECGVLQALPSAETAPQRGQDRLSCSPKDGASGQEQVQQPKVPIGS